MRSGAAASLQVSRRAAAPGRRSWSRSRPSSPWWSSSPPGGGARNGPGDLRPPGGRGLRGRLGAQGQPRVLVIAGQSDCANFVSQCLTAGGLRPTYDAGREWRAGGLDIPDDRLGQLRRAEAGAHITRRDDSHALRRPGHADRAVGLAGGDIVYLGNVEDGELEWQHVDHLRRSPRRGVGVRQPHHGAAEGRAGRLVPGALQRCTVLPGVRRTRSSTRTTDGAAGAEPAARRAIPRPARPTCRAPSRTCPTRCGKGTSRRPRPARRGSRLRPTVSSVES